MKESEKINPSYLREGTRVGAYEIVGKVADGGFGHLYKVRRNERLYALKLGRQRLKGLREEEREHEEVRIDREIAALVSLRHPNIVRVHAFDRWPDLEGGFPYLVMDLVEGEPLNEWCADVSPSLSRICAVFEKIASAVDQMHGLGIYHRDLKSENVLVRADGEPVIIDFGIARPQLAYNVTRAASVGTITHHAPEYVRFWDSVAFKKGEPFEWRPATELHAVGYMLYEVLAGCPPFPRGTRSKPANEADILFAIKKVVPKRLSEINARVPPALDVIVMRLLEKDPAMRPQRARELGEMLARAREAARAAGDGTWDRPFDVPLARPEAGRPAAVVPDALARAEGELGGAPPDEPRPGVVAADREGSRDGAGAAVDADRSAPQLAAGVPAALFDAPSADAARAYDDGAAPSSQPESTADRPEPLPSGIRAAVAQVAASAPRRRLNPLLVGGGVLVLGLFLVLAALARSTPGPRRPQTLFSAAEEKPGGADELLAVPVPAAPAVEEAAPLRPAVLQSAELDVRPPVSADTRKKGARRSAKTPQDPPWLLRSRRLEPVSASAVGPQKPRGVPLGAHILAKLLSNLDSRTIGNGPVEAMLPGPLILRGELVLPARTLAYGTASESGGRFTVRFTRLRLPDNTEIAFEGIALARDDGKPGLAAARRIQAEPARGESLGTRIAKGTGNILLDTITGGTREDIARNAGHTVLNNESPSASGGQSAILLDAGVVFDIWVEHAF